MMGFSFQTPFQALKFFWIDFQALTCYTRNYPGNPKTKTETNNKTSNVWNNGLCNSQSLTNSFAHTD